MIKTYDERTCVFCGDTYVPTGPTQRFCSRRCKYRERQRLYHMEREIAGNPVGKSGGNYGRTGKEHWAYKNGILEFQRRLRYQLKYDVRYCERCGADLQNVLWTMWCAHHRDHDRTNNVRENLELLCKRCHQVEHECWKGLHK